MAQTNGVDCSGFNQWSPTAVYVGGNQVVVKTSATSSYLYLANWWTKNENPIDNTGSIWTNKGQCNVGTDNTQINLSWGPDTPLQSIRNLNTGLVNINTDPKDVTLQTDYYKLNVQGRTNLIGLKDDGSADNNTLEVWSGNPEGANKDMYRQYLTIGNGTFTDGNTYAVIGSNGYKSLPLPGTPKDGGTNLLLQNNNGKVGIGNFTSPLSNSLEVKGNIAVTDKIGIGTITPQVPLHVNGKVLIGNNPDPNDPALLRVNGTIHSGEVRADGNVIATQELHIRAVNDALDVNKRALVSGNSEQLVINWDGDFGGGVRVDGKGLSARKLVVTPNGSYIWPDYVFKTDYHLKDLTEVEQYINQNHHLEAVPSAKEVKETGVDLAEMVKIQMQKIEELTLYIIQLNKEVEKLKNK